MKTASLFLLAAAGLSLSGYAYAGDEASALSADQMRAELASVAKERNAVEAALTQYVRKRHSRSRMTTSASRTTSSDNVVATAFALKSSRRATERLLARLRILIERRDELNAEMKKAGAFTADEIRAQIQQIDSQLARYGQASLPSDTGQNSFSRPSMRYSVSSSLSNGTYGYQALNDVAARTPIMSSGPRASAWRASYRLAEERKELYATLQALENSQD